MIEPKINLPESAAGIVALVGAIAAVVGAYLMNLYIVGVGILLVVISLYFWCFCHQKGSCKNLKQR
ncbi:MAG: hypothetical protein KKA79_03745 [Nanoarchaeota archaeon]|nr:hypothetical protein [Nanoarchaeota archaeon]